MWVEIGTNYLIWQKMKIINSLISLISLLIVTILLVPAPTGYAFDLPADFENITILLNLNDPDGFAFSPDGRIFISERINGQLLVAKQAGDGWVINRTPFYTFDIPKDEGGQPEARRSAGLRDIAFDPDFENNGYIYAYYMKDDLLHNRVVRIKADPTNPDVADSTFGEETLIELPFNNSFSSGSHNGGALEFGNDGKLYITTGDGWTGEFEGDPVQSLSTYTGKVLRINSDGSIPADNPFYSQTTGSFRAIYALGLRNPYSMSKHPQTGTLYINEARGTKKADIYIVEAAANYGHEGSGIGNDRTPWANGSGGGGELITGGAWYPQSGPFPADYHGNYFVAMWGGNGDPVGQINIIQSDSDTTARAFETNVGQVGANGIEVKPVITRIGPDGNLYYMLTTYTTESGTIQMVRYTGQETVSTPSISPNGATAESPVTVSLSTTTPDAIITYTTDNSEPTAASTQYTAPFTITETRVVKAKAFKSGFNPSATASALFTIGEQPLNQPPIVDAGPDLIATTGESVSLDGSATTDPDGDDNFLTDEEWTQLSGPTVTINDATEEVATFTPPIPGTYRFRLRMSDTIDFGSDEVTVSVFEAPRAGTPVALYTFYEGSDNVVHDVSGFDYAQDLTIDNLGSVTWGFNELSLNSSAVVRSDTAATKIASACAGSNSMAIEAWIRAATDDQDGPARIISFSETTLLRNFTLGQVGNEFDIRIRTSSTNNNGEPSLRSTSGPIKDEYMHVVLSREGSGTIEWVTLTVDGSVAYQSSLPGNLSGWDAGYHLLLGNEATGDRPWLGQYGMVAIYCEALSSADITANIAAGRPVSTVIIDPEATLFLPVIVR